MQGHGELLTLAEVAQELRCSKAHVSKIVAGRIADLAPLPALRLGRRRLVRRSTLEAWQASQESAPGAKLVGVASIHGRERVKGI
jgi:excisionase family DNA binding protein